MGSTYRLTCRSSSVCRAFASVTSVASTIPAARCAATAFRWLARLRPASAPSHRPVPPTPV